MKFICGSLGFVEKNLYLSVQQYCKEVWRNNMHNAVSILISKVFIHWSKCHCFHGQMNIKKASTVM